MAKKKKANKKAQKEWLEALGTNVKSHMDLTRDLGCDEKDVYSMTTATAAQWFLEPKLKAKAGK